MYGVQSLWSAAHYQVGVLLIVMANGGYAVMDQLARAQGGEGAWPGFGSIDISAIARALGCPSARVQTHEQLVAQLDSVLPGLARRDEPLVLEVAVEGREH
jgi:benzoylformate decarboxylase